MRTPKRVMGLSNGLKCGSDRQLMYCPRTSEDFELRSESMGHSNGCGSTDVKQG